MIDLIAPDNSVCPETRNLMRLWQHVIITAARDAAESRQGAYDNYLWSKKAWFERVCEMANVDAATLRKLFYNMHNDNAFRITILRRITGKNSTYISAKISTYIQEELFV